MPLASSFYFIFIFVHLTEKSWISFQNSMSFLMLSGRGKRELPTSCFSLLLYWLIQIFHFKDKTTRTTKPTEAIQGEKRGEKVFYINKKKTTTTFCPTAKHWNNKISIISLLVCCFFLFLTWTNHEVMSVRGDICLLRNNLEISLHENIYWTTSRDLL